MNASKKEKSDFPQTFTIALYLAVGVCCGIAMTKWKPDATVSLPGLLLHLLVMFALLYASILIQVFLHEFGHTLFGLMTGYRFLSMRVGSAMLLRRKGNLRFGFFSADGPFGQSQLLPPETDNGIYPSGLYFLGGVILNFLSATVFGVLFFVGTGYGLLRIFYLFLALFGAVMALTGGIPMQANGVDNDARNAILLHCRPEARDAFYRQMQIMEQTANGVRLRDMPEEWFEMPSPEGMQNALISATAVLACKRLVDAHEFEKADRRIHALLNAETGISDVSRVTMRCDSYFCELAGERRPRVLASRLDAQQRKQMKVMRTNLTVLRTEYLNALLVDVDTKKAEAFGKKLDRCAASTPYPVDAKAEQELLEIAQRAPKEHEMTLEEAMKFNEAEMPEIEMTLEEAMCFDSSAVIHNSDPVQKG